MRIYLEVENNCASLAFHRNNLGCFVKKILRWLLYSGVCFHDWLSWKIKPVELPSHIHSHYLPWKVIQLHYLVFWDKDYELDWISLQVLSRRTCKPFSLNFEVRALNSLALNWTLLSKLLVQLARYSLISAASNLPADSGKFFFLCNCYQNSLTLSQENMDKGFSKIATILRNIHLVQVMKPSSEGKKSRRKRKLLVLMHLSRSISHT